MDASLVIPVFNNEKTLIAQLKKCEGIMRRIVLHYEIIVCDDNSTDDSAFFLKKYFSNNQSFRLLFNKKNQGIAKNILGLYKKAKYQYIVLFSADGDWNPKDIERLLLFVYKHKQDIVIGKRLYMQYSLYRKIVSFFYNFLSYIIFQVKTFDAGSIKVFRRELFQQTQLISKSVFFEAEFIIRTAKKGGKVTSIPVNFTKFGMQKSKGGNFTLVISSLWDLINLRLRI